MVSFHKRRFVFLPIVCAITISVSAQNITTLTQNISDRVHLKLGDELPAFELEELIDGKASRLDKRLNDQPIIIDFWATWCAPCIKAFDTLNALQARYEPEVNFLYVSDEERYKIEHFLKRKSLNGIIGMDLDRSIFDGWSISALPTTLLIDKKRRIREIIIGNYSLALNTTLVDKKAFSEHLQTLIETTLDN